MKTLIATFILIFTITAAFAENVRPIEGKWNLESLFHYFDSPDTPAIEKFWAMAYVHGAMMAALTTRISLDSGFEAAGNKNRTLYNGHPCAKLSRRTATESIVALRSWTQKNPARRAQQNPALAIAMEVRDTCTRLKADHS
jgi:hypothetical protein